MIYTRMVGTRNVPMRSSIGELGYKRVESKQDTSEFQQRDQHKERNQQFKLVVDEVQDLLVAETVTNVETVQETLRERQFEIERSDMDIAKKQDSLEYLQNMQVMCSTKISQLRMEGELQRKMTQANEQGDEELLEQLASQYSYEKKLRKANEYSNLQASMKRANKRVQRYTASQNGVSVVREWNEGAGRGSYISATI